jgi:hypothetical protein
MNARRLSWLLLLLSTWTFAYPVLANREIAGLWEEPTDLDRRDLFYGPGGRAVVPSETAPYEMIEVDTKGFSSGYDVRDAQGRKWSVKLGPEAQPEVVVSRLLWAVGYHQPATYYIRRWTLTENGRRTAQGPARFRLERAGEENVGNWSWRDNPFIGSRPLAGLVVLMVIVNNWDLKTSQNVIYRVPSDGDASRDRYVVRDLGGSLGKTAWIIPGTRNDLRGFEEEAFIKGVAGNRVRFAYKGGWLEPQVVAGVAPRDVRWISDLMARLSPRQWSDAFRAGGYSPEETARYVARLRGKVEEGQAVH